jgi:ribose/xylose/arabinose/galactoside ABC-type transport system permease subunit
MNKTTFLPALKKYASDMKDNLIIIGVLVVVLVVFSFWSPYFFTRSNLLSVLLNATPVAIIAIGQALCITARHFDMAVGMTSSIGGCLAAYLVVLQGWPAAPAFLLGLFAGFCSGMIAGLSVSRLRMNAFITTFGIQEIYRGVLFLWTEGLPFVVVGRPDFTTIGQGKIFGVQFPIVILVVIYILTTLFIRYTRVGRSILLVGNNPTCARISGINVKNIELFVFGLMGVLSAIAGIMFATRMASAQPFAGANYTLDSIAAAIVGGTSMMGGKCNLAMVFVGVMILYLVKNGLVMIGLQDFYQYIASGVFVFFGVLVQIRREKN